MIWFITATDSELLALRTAVEELPDGFDAVRGANPWHFDDGRFPDLDGVRAVIVRLLGGRRSWEASFDALRAACADRGVALIACSGEAIPDAELTALSTVPSGTVTEVFSYLVHGGPANLAHCLRFVADTVLLEGHGFDPPAVVPDFGVWRAAPADDRAVIGVVFYRAHLVAGNTRFVDDLCDAIEAGGGRPLALWCYSLRGDGATPVVAALRENGAVAVVTTVLAAGGVAAGAGLTGRPGGLDGEAWDAQALAGLGIPIVQAPSSGWSREQWLESDAGLSPYDVTSGIAIPEFDGRIIGPTFAFAEIVDDGDELGSSVKAYRTVPDRTARVAGIALRHAQLRRRPVEDRRVAIVLSAYPTKRSRLGNAVGLDTPASAIDLLTALDGAATR